MAELHTYTVDSVPLLSQQLLSHLKHLVYLLPNFLLGRGLFVQTLLDHCDDLIVKVNLIQLHFDSFFPFDQLGMTICDFLLLLHIGNEQVHEMISHLSLTCKELQLYKFSYTGHSDLLVVLGLSHHL